MKKARISSLLAIILICTANTSTAQTKPKAIDQRKIMETMDKAFGVQPSGRDLAEREYRICMVDNTTRLLANKVDAAPLIATVASGICSNHLGMIYSFETERRNETEAGIAMDQVRNSMVEEMTIFIVKRRAGITS